MALPILTNRPIDSITVSIVTAVKNAVADLEVDIFLVGATARIILLEHVYGLSTGRATRDIDFAFAVKNWDQFDLIKKRLLSTSQFVEVKGLALPICRPCHGGRHSKAKSWLLFCER